MVSPQPSPIIAFCSRPYMQSPINSFLTGYEYGVGGIPVCARIHNVLKTLTTEVPHVASRTSFSPWCSSDGVSAIRSTIVTFTKQHEIRSYFMKEIAQSHPSIDWF